MTSVQPVAPLEDLGHASSMYNIEAEQALLGALLINNEVIFDIGFLQPDDFYEPIHARIFKACRALVDKGQRADPTTLKTFFGHDQALNDIGGTDYLRRLDAGTITLINSVDYAQAVKDCSVRRQLHRIGLEMAAAAGEPSPEESAKDQIASSQEKLDSLSQEGVVGGPRRLSTVMEEAITQVEELRSCPSRLTGIPTGIPALDEFVSGLPRREVTVFAGATGMGKTGLAESVALAAARAGHRVIFFSLEMDATELARRAFAEHLGTPYAQIRKGDVAPSDLREASKPYADSPIFIDDTAALSVSEIRNRARRLHRVEPLSLIVVDYLQLIRPETTYRGNRVAEVSEISASLKALAKELGVAIVAISQLSRQIEQRDDKRPRLSDLRESGAIEQDAALVIFLFRRSYYTRRAGPPKNLTTDALVGWEADLRDEERSLELIIGKNRFGPDGRLTVQVDLATNRFGEQVTAVSRGTCE